MYIKGVDARKYTKTEYTKPKDKKKKPGKSTTAGVFSFHP